MRKINDGFYVGSPDGGTRDERRAKAAAEFEQAKLRGEIDKEKYQLIIDDEALCEKHAPPAPTSQIEAIGIATVMELMFRALIASDTIQEMSGGDPSKVQECIDKIGCPVCFGEALKAKREGKLS